jgi:hypothetical protein
MHAFPELRFDLMKFGGEPLPHGDPTDHELPVPIDTTEVCESEEVEGFRLLLPVEASDVSPCEAAKPNKTRLIGMKFQGELSKSVVQCLQETPGFGLVLETHYEVIGPANDDHISSGDMRPPPLDPKVQDIMEIHVRQERRNGRPLGRALIAGGPHPILDHSSLQPLSDEPEHPPVGDPMLQELDHPVVTNCVEVASNVRI